MKNIAVLTSGGDAPGMNACIRALVRAGIYYGYNMFGIEAGYQGLIEDEIKPLTVRDVGNIIQLGGTILKTSRSKEFTQKEGFAKALNNCKKHKIDVIVAIGGDGTFTGARQLVDAGINVIAIPATIDNDLGYTDFTLGFDTAVNTVVQSLNNIRDTSMAHERLCVVEVMGRECGDIALMAGVSAGAEVVLVPEVKFNVSQVCKKLKASYKSGKKGSIVVVAEGVGSADSVLEKIKKGTGFDGRAMSVDYIQRGGSPTADDRVLASRFGVRAIELVNENKFGLAIGVKDGKLFEMPVDEALKQPKSFDFETYKLTDIISI